MKNIAFLYSKQNRDKSVGIAMGHGPYDQGLSPIRGKSILLFSVNTSSSADAAFQTVGTGDSCRVWGDCALKLTTHLHYCWG
jgi:hypothetical protein